VKVPAPVRALLYPLSVCYAWIVAARLALYRSGRLKQRRLKAAVISVGNLTVGGTGKTPMVLWMAEKFLAEGKRVAILSRGYRGADGTSDEIAMLRRRLGDRVAFGVGADRYAEGQRIEAEHPIDVFLLDDGFQHLQLARDVDVLLLDGTHPLKNEALLPAGTLREPISAGERADIVVVTRDSGQADETIAHGRRESFFFAQTRLLGFRVCGERGIPRYLSEIEQRPLFAFCGIGNADAFFADLRRWHVPVAGTMAFRDHHKYGAGDIERLRHAALACGAQGFVTTEKDEQNLRDAGALNTPVYAAVIDFVISSQSEFSAAIERTLAAKRGAAA
jgi:tetraacyldisaccharide 4'-kinase